MKEDLQRILTKKVQQRMKTYNVTIDYIRAVLMALVILVHIVNFGDLYPDVKYSVLAFFMPAFLILTGFLVNVEKNVAKFSLYLVRLILPYTIMVVAFMVMSLYLPVRGGVEDLSPETVCRVLFVTSIGPYWYFRVMIICGALYYLSFMLFRRCSLVSRLSAFATLLILFSYLTPSLGLSSAAYYYIGVLLRHGVKDLSKVMPHSLLPVIPFSLLIANAKFHDWGCLAVPVCCFCFFSFTARVSDYFRGRFSSVMSYIGRNTLPIYIFHPIFTMAAKYALPLFAFDKTGLLHTFLTIITGLAGSLAIAYAMDYCHVSIIFGKKRILR